MNFAKPLKRRKSRKEPRVESSCQKITVAFVDEHGKATPGSDVEMVITPTPIDDAVFGSQSAIQEKKSSSNNKNKKIS